jgi:hypothetical protein
VQILKQISPNFKEINIYPKTLPCALARSELGPWEDFIFLNSISRVFTIKTVAPVTTNT